MNVISTRANVVAADAAGDLHPEEVAPQNVLDHVRMDLDPVHHVLALAFAAGDRDREEVLVFGNGHADKDDLVRERAVVQVAERGIAERVDLLAALEFLTGLHRLVIDDIVETDVRECPVRSVVVHQHRSPVVPAE